MTLIVRGIIIIEGIELEQGFGRARNVPQAIPE